MSDDNEGTVDDGHIDAVREALRSLAGDGSQPEESFSVQRKPFDAPDSDDAIDLPADCDSPATRDYAGYLVKQMEYVQTFLVAHRLGRELSISPPLVPGGRTISPHIRRVLAAIGRGSELERPTKELRYYPLPYLPAEITVNVPFVDLAGFIIVLLTDYKRWVGDQQPSISAAADAEIETALEFLIDENTFIKDERGIGWAFVPKTDCPTRDVRNKLPEQRHVFPTARAVVAIRRFLASSDDDSVLAQRAKSVLPEVLSWLETLNRKDGEFFFSGDRDSSPYMSDHVYATEALITLANLRSPELDARPLAVKGIEVLLKDMGRGTQQGAWGEMERLDSYPVYLASGNSLIHYKSRATRATLLATLSQGIEMLDAGNILRNRLRSNCFQIVRDLVVNQKNPAGLWPKEYTQFHWVLAAVEALLRFSQHVPRVNLDTSVEEIHRAIDLLLRDETFASMLRELLVKKLEEVQMAVSQVEDDEEQTAERGANT